MLNIFNSNCIRNHGFLRDQQGWYLSPAYDINPNKNIATHSICLNFDSAEPSLDVLYDAIEYLRLDSDEASEIVRDIHQTLSNWREIAKKFGANNSQIDLMSPAFQMVNEELIIPPQPKKRKRN